MATFDLPEMPETRMSPQLFMGAASPLWAYFGAAAAGGVAYWWMTRWTQPVNLEALFGAVSRAATLPAPMAEAAVQSVAETVGAAVETVEEVADAVAETVAETVTEALPETPVGGEAAPISPIVEALAAPEPAPTPEAEPEAIVEAAPEPVAEAPPEPMMEATADPIPEPVAKPRIRKTPPANGLEA